jgi:RsiW-degrading membrane proteinase PrsW (M82 family)
MSVRAILGIILTVAFVLLIFYLAWQGKTETETFNLLVGALTGAALSHVLGYYFGTTESSQTKDDTIKIQARTAAGDSPPPATPPAPIPPTVAPQGP